MPFAKTSGWYDDTMREANRVPKIPTITPAQKNMIVRFISDPVLSSVHATYRVANYRKADL